MVRNMVAPPSKRIMQKKELNFLYISVAFGACAAFAWTFFVLAHKGEQKDVAGVTDVGLVEELAGDLKGVDIGPMTLQGSFAGCEEKSDAPLLGTTVETDLAKKTVRTGDPRYTFAIPANFVVEMDGARPEEIDLLICSPRDATSSSGWVRAANVRVEKNIKGSLKDFAWEYLGTTEEGLGGPFEETLVNGVAGYSYHTITDGYPAKEITIHFFEHDGSAYIFEEEGLGYSPLIAETVILDE